MTIEAAVTRKEKLTVHSCAQHEKYAGTWVLKAQADFQRDIKNWYLKKGGESDIEPGVYLCLMERGPKWATEGEGDDDWRYNWKIIRFNVDPETAEPVEAPVPTEDAKRQAVETAAIIPPAAPIILPERTNQDDHPNKRSSIERQAQDKNKVEIVCKAADVVIAQIGGGGEAITPADLIKRIDWLYNQMWRIPTWNQYAGIPSEATGPPESDDFGSIDLLEGDYDPDREADLARDAE